MERKRRREEENGREGNGRERKEREGKRKEVGNYFDQFLECDRMHTS